MILPVSKLQGSHTHYCGGYTPELCHQGEIWELRYCCGDCGRLNSGPLKISMSKSLESMNITLHSKTDFVDVSFEMGEYSVLSRWPSKVS